MPSVTLIVAVRFKCPPALVNDFTPAQFEEMVTTFQQYDADGSGTIDLDGTKRGDLGTCALAKY